MRDAYVGVDVSFAKGKRLPVSICSWRETRLVPEALRELPLSPPRGYGNASIIDGRRVDDFATATGQYILKVCDHLHLVPVRIGIDSPRLPRDDERRRRAAEVAMDSAGISCFTTPSAQEFEQIIEKARRHLGEGKPESHIPHANQLWMIVGFRLFEQLMPIAPCIEVYPQATARILGTGRIHKRKEGGVEEQLRQVSRFTGWPSERREEGGFSDIAFGPAHDRLDAYLSAWVAALEETDRVPYGNPPNDVIWVPRIGDGISYAPAPPGVMSKRREPLVSARIEGAQRMTQLCPACGKHEFKAWPLGWDAHAAHRCTGLESRTESERKREFKQRFGHLFRKGDA